DKWNTYEKGISESGKTGTPINWINKSSGGPHEANYLKLDCTKIKRDLSWHPRWNIDAAMEKLVEWYRVYADKGDIQKVTDEQIGQYFES
ncbi:MAG: CDP-glucose 4,6-dehydratase, partial [Lachnospiraceae bacterium]|nr:CDP-glucose 4,6-dehydratase [Lachnospiraceae bacterium]